MSSFEARFGVEHAIISALLFASPAVAGAQVPLLFRQPALSANEICFTFAGDLWLVKRNGGEARRLTIPPGTKSDCHFSPDGASIAYTSNSEGNTDVYVIAAGGGTPKRLTYHPAPDQARGWTPDGKVLFESTRNGQSVSGLPPRLYSQAVDGVLATPIDLPSGWDGSFSPDGKRLAYMPIVNANNAWKRYRGGRTTPIWIANLSDGSVELVPRQNSTDKSPMWVGSTVFFISDRDGPATLYAYDVSAKSVTRVIDNKGLDIKSASAGPGGIVYEQFGLIKLHELATGTNSDVPIHLSSELTNALPHWVSVSDKLQHPAISPSGVRAAFEARGEIITVPAKKGDARDVTHTAGATERYPSWSPDGQTLAYFSDAGGAYHLELRDQPGMGQPRAIALGDSSTYYYNPAWSPDGKYICYSNSRGEIWVTTIATGVSTKVDTDPLGDRGEGGFRISWSPDSRWLTYARSIRNRLNAAFVYNQSRGSAMQITDGQSDANAPVFDQSGKYIYFVASTDVGPSADFSMMTFDHPVTRSLYAIVLRNDLPSPLAPESDEEKAKGDSAAKSSAKAALGDVKGAKAMKPNKDSSSKVQPPEPVRIDFENIDQRTVAMPALPRNYTSIFAGKAGALILAEAPLIPVDLQDGDVLHLVLYKFDLAGRKTDKLLDDVTDLDVSRDGEKLLYKQQDKWFIASLAEAIKPGDSPINTSNIQVAVDPRAEWTDMYRDAFRLQRAFFYDPSYHGLDLGQTEKYYSQWIAGLGSRDDLDYLFQEAFGNLTVGHLYVAPPSSAPPGSPRNGVLGADYRIENGRWQFAKVYSGENWNPEFRAPLTQPGVNVREGEYLLAIDGRDLTSRESIDQVLDGTAGKSVILHVGPNPTGVGARDVTVVPLGSESMLRHLAWIDTNRRLVDKLSGGKLAYIYIPNTANEGYTRFNRYFFAQQDKLGAVVDERYNGGGNIADYMIEYLRRDAPFNYVTARYGADVPIPAGAIYGPKVMLINEYAGSGGDELPWLFRRFKVGEIVGKRTWGGLVGIGGYPSLMDGGSVTAPRIAIWTPESEYAVENHGVAPDVDVDIEPAAWRAGHDPQLERAVAILMDHLARDSRPALKRPAFPVWSAGKAPTATVPRQSPD
ncbi:MAG: PDZ domain-containing protein [Gemmatimonadales bacterium]